MIFNTNQYATGLALSLFGIGFSAFAGFGYDAREPERAPKAIPGLAELPVLGPALFWYHPLVYLSIAAHGRARLVPVPFAHRPDPARRRASRRSPRTRSATGAARSGSPRWWSAARSAGSRAPTSRSIYTHLWVEGMIAGQRLDRARAHDLRDLAAGARAARRVPLRRRHDAAASPAGAGRADRQPPHWACFPTSRPSSCWC